MVGSVFNCIETRAVGGKGTDVELGNVAYFYDMLKALYNLGP